MGCGSSSDSAANHHKPSFEPFNLEALETLNMLKLREYTIQSQLGSGASCVVSTAKSSVDGKFYALKKLVPEMLKFWKTEVPILFKLQHPNVMQFRDAWTDSKNLYIATHLLTGGEVLDRVDFDLDHCKQMTEEELNTFLAGKGLSLFGTRAERETALSKAVKASDPPFTDKVASQIVRQMLLGLAHAHSCGISHRDLKLENYVFEDMKTFNLRLIDFGMAYMGPDETLNTQQCGTIFYMAPELLPGVFPIDSGYTNRQFKQADMWAIGVCCHLLLTGDIPWKHTEPNELFKEIGKGEWNFSEHKEQQPSEGAMDLVRKLIVPDPEQRLTAEQALKHSWVTGVKASHDEISKKVKSNLRSFHHSNKLRKAAGHLLARNMSAGDKERLQVLFKQYDTDQSGQLSQTEMANYLAALANLEGNAAVVNLRKNMHPNTNGEITLDELMAAHARSRFDFQDKEYVRKMFQDFQADQLTEEAVNPFVPIIQDVLDELREGADKSSKLDFSNFVKLIESCVSKHSDSSSMMSRQSNLMGPYFSLRSPQLNDSIPPLGAVDEE